MNECHQMNAIPFKWKDDGILMSPMHINVEYVLTYFFFLKPYLISWVFQLPWYANTGQQIRCQEKDSRRYNNAKYQRKKGHNITLFCYPLPYSKPVECRRVAVENMREETLVNGNELFRGKTENRRRVQEIR